MMKHFLIIGKQPVALEGIISFLKSDYPNAQFTALYQDNILEDILFLKYDCFIIDTSFSLNNPIGMMKHILQHQVDAKIIIFSSETDPIKTKNNINAGAKAVITRNASKEMFINSIKAVYNNQYFLCNEIKKALTLDIMNGEKKSKQDLLSPIDIELLNSLSNCLDSHEINTVINLHTKTERRYFA